MSSRQVLPFSALEIVKRSDSKPLLYSKYLHEVEKSPYVAAIVIADTRVVTDLRDFEPEPSDGQPEESACLHGFSFAQHTNYSVSANSRQGSALTPGATACTMPFPEVA